MLDIREKDLIKVKKSTFHITEEVCEVKQIRGDEITYGNCVRNLEYAEEDVIEIWRLQDCDTYKCIYRRAGGVKDGY